MTFIFMSICTSELRVSNISRYSQDIITSGTNVQEAYSSVVRNCDVSKHLSIRFSKMLFNV